MNIHLRYFLIFITCVYTQRAYAQVRAQHVEHYNSENGFTNTTKNMVIDRNGYLWIASEAGLIRYDGQSFKFYNSTNSCLKYNRLICIGLLEDSSVFVEDVAKNYYAVSKQRFLEVKADSIAGTLQSFLQYEKVYAIYDSCLARYHQQLITENALPDYGLITLSVINSIVYVQGKLFYLNKKRQLFCVDTALNTFRQLTYNSLLQHRISTANIKSTPVSLLTYANDLFLRWGGTIYKLKIGTTSEVAAEPVLQVDSIPNITCYAAIPNTGTVIVGTMATGLYIYSQQYFSTLTVKDKESNVFYAQQPYGNNGALMKKGILFPDKFIPFDASYNSESILRSKEDNYYLQRTINGDSTIIVQYNKRLENLNTIPLKHFLIRCFNQLSDGSIWFAGDKGFGEIKDDTIQLKPRPAGLEEEFPISTFIQVDKQLLLAGGRKGLFLFNLLQNRATILPALNKIVIRTLYRSSKGIILIGTYGKGFYALYKNRIIAFPLDANHYLASANSFMEDVNGFIWITTNNGLFQASLEDIVNYADGRIQSIYYYYYDASSGFLSNEFNGGCVPSGIKLADGKFSLPSMQGLVQFYPDSVKPILPVSKIFLDNIMTDTSFISDDKAIKISHKVKWLHFFVSSPYFGNSYNRYIEYNLEGFDNNWYTVNNNVIIFSKLQTGDYTLKLRKKAGFGKDNWITKTLSFSVEPAFYQTIYFQILLACCIAGIGYLLYRLRLNYLIRQKNKLKEEVAFRTKEQLLLIENLGLTVAELEQSKEEIYQTLLFKEKLAMIVSHDIQSPLRFLASTMQRLHYKTLQNDFSNIQKLTGEMRNASSNVFRFVEDFSVWLSNIHGNIGIHTEWFSLADLLTELNFFFTEQLAVKHNEIIINVAPSLFINIDYELFKIVLRNVIDNANKHTNNGTIRIAAGYSTVSSIIISDNGNGMSREIVDDLYLRLQGQNESYFRNDKKQGFGYLFVIDFCRLLNMELNIESKVGEGTTIVLKNLQLSEMHSNSKS